MPRKKTGLTIDITGMSLKDIKGLGNQIRKYDLKSIKTITSRLVSAVNKRIVRLKNDVRGQMSPTYKAFERSGEKYYSIKGLNKNSLISLYYELSHKTDKITSLGEWKKYQDALYKELGINFIDEETQEWDTETEKDFWNMYNKYLEFDTAYSTSLKGKAKSKTISNSVIEYIKNSIDWKKLTLRQIKNRVKKLYEEVKTYDSESNYFRGGDEYEEQN